MYMRPLVDLSDPRRIKVEALPLASDRYQFDADPNISDDSCIWDDSYMICRLPYHLCEFAHINSPDTPYLFNLSALF